MKNNKCVRKEVIESDSECQAGTWQRLSIQAALIVFHH